MINLEHKLTVDDLIVEYMICKVTNGYEPGFSGKEFIDFLHFFEKKIQVEDALYNSEKLFKRFFERKAENDWSTIKDYRTGEKEINPHMDMKYSENDNDYIIKANYQLSPFDESIINTYFMHDKRPKEIRNRIKDYLSNQSKRVLDETFLQSDKEIEIGKKFAAEIIAQIWQSYISKQVKNHSWPSQCYDIHKYLFERDLAEIIGLKSIKKELLTFYRTISKRIAIMYCQDRNLKISLLGSYLERANYDLLVQGYENIMSLAFGEYKKSLKMDLSVMKFIEHHAKEGVYDFDDDPDIKTTVTSIEGKNIQKLVKSLDKDLQNL